MTAVLCFIAGLILGGIAWGKIRYFDGYAAAYREIMSVLDRAGTSEDNG